MAKRRLLYVLSAVAILLGYAIRIHQIGERDVLYYDEAFSYLSATGHLGEFYEEVVIAENHPVGSWVEAPEWKRFINLENRLVFDQIRADEIRFDYHPPLYFWILNVWTLLFGASIWAGSLLNLLIETVILALVLKICYHVFGSVPESLLVASSWFLNPITIDASIWIRQYVLLTLWALLFAFLLYKLIYHPTRLRFRPRNAVLLIVVTIAGMMTHYYFIWVLVSGVVLIGIRYALKEKKRFCIVLLCTLGGFLIFSLIYVDFYTDVIAYFRRILGMNLISGLNYRVYRTARTNVILLSHIALAVTLSGFIFLLPDGKIKSRFDRLVGSLRKMTTLRDVYVYMFALTVLIVGIINLLYLSLFSPIHTMAGKYVNFVSPLIAFIPLLILNLSRRKSTVYPLFIVGILFFSLATALYPYTRDNNYPKAGMIGPTEFVLVDNLYPGFLETVIYSLDDQNKVFARSQGDLLTEPDEWLTRLNEKGGIYVSTGDEKSTEQDRKTLLNLLEQNNRVELDKTLALNFVKDWAVFRPLIYRVTPKAAR